MNKLTIPQTGSVTADNATNNDTLMDALKVLLQEHGFCGHARRVRCFPHTLNLMAKATLRQFEKIKKKKKCTDDDEIPDYNGLGNDMGNPGVFQGNLYPYPSKPVPI